MNAAVQHFRGTMAVFPMLVPPRTQPLAPLRVSPDPASPSPARMPDPKPREFFIQGITLAGKTFRPSDWSERLAGALSSFRPKSGTGGIGAHIGYSDQSLGRKVLPARVMPWMKNSRGLGADMRAGDGEAGSGETRGGANGCTRCGPNIGKTAIVSRKCCTAAFMGSSNA